MYYINKNYKYVEIIKKSEFITLLFKLDKIEDVVFYIERTKIEYPKATHYCHAFIFDNTMQQNDDGEPKGSAGLPILKAIQFRNLNKVLIIIVRYFGGIKLGQSGLTRAYSNLSMKVSQDIELMENVEYQSYLISFNYDKIVFFKNFFNLNNIEILEESYDIYANFKIVIKDISILDKYRYLFIKFDFLNKIIRLENIK